MISVTIARHSDPFKKYWWVILLAFAGIGGWLCMPYMDGGIGSGRVSAPQEGSLRGPQSLDAVSNPSGAQGGPVDLSMAGSRGKKTDGSMTSSLYQAPPEEPKPAPPAAAPTTLADALRDVSRKSASADSSGWGGQTPQKGFTAPKANFGSMSGFSGSSGSGASASSHAGGSVTGFGAQKAETGVTFAQGLRGDAGEGPAGAKGKAMGALQGASNAAMAANKQLSNDAARAGAATSFDGSGGGSTIGGSGMTAATGAGVYAKLDSAPINLKANSPNLDQRKVEPPAATKADATDPNDQMRQQMLQMVMMMAIAGIMGGI
jgi:hypothetical protein